MSIESYLKDLSGKMVLSSSEKESIVTSINALKEHIFSYFSDVTSVEIFGSYDRGTILPRKYDSNSDVDVMIIFKNENRYKPQSFLNRLKDFAEHYYSRSEIYQSSPTIVLELNHIKFELVPTYVEYGSHYIPDGPSDWMYTNPSKLKDDLIECNKNNDYKIKPVVRLLKHWNIKNNSRDISSYELEKTIAENMKYAYISCTSYCEYLKKAFSEIEYKTNTSKVDEAIDKINDAIKLENEGYPYLALSEITELFPEV